MASDLIERLKWPRDDFHTISDAVGLMAEAADEIASLRTALAIERERAEKAEKELDLAQVVISEWGYTKERAESAEASLAEAKRMLKPFADLNVPANDKWTCGTFLVGHPGIIAAARFLAQEEGRPTPKGGPDHG